MTRYEMVRAYFAPRIAGERYASTAGCISCIEDGEPDDRESQHIFAVSMASGAEIADRIPAVAHDDNTRLPYCAACTRAIATLALELREWSDLPRCPCAGIRLGHRPRELSLMGHTVGLVVDAPPLCLECKAVRVSMQADLHPSAGPPS